MKKQLLIFLFSIITLSAFGQAGSYSISVLRSRVNDSTAVNGATASGYGYLYYNNDPSSGLTTANKWKIWDGTAEVPLATMFSTGGTFWNTTGTTNLTGDVLINGGAFGMTFSSEKPIYNISTVGDKSFGFYTFPEVGGEQHVGAVAADAVAGKRTYFYAQVDSIALLAEDQLAGDSTRILLTSDKINFDFHSGADLRINDNPGSSGYVLQSNGAGAAPTWVAPSGGGGGLDILATIRTETATHDLDATDLASIAAGERLVIHMNSASPLTVEIPLNATVAFSIGTIIDFYQEGAGQVTFDPLSTVVMRSPANADKMYAQYSSARLRKVATDTWVLSGDITP